MPIGRGRELREAGRLLDRAAGGAGGLLTFTGASGAGKTALLQAAADEALRRGFEVLPGSPPAGQPGRLVWAQLLRDAGAPDALAAGLLGADAGPLELDTAARGLASADPRLIVVDDVDRGRPDTAAMLSVVAARCAASGTAVIATSATPVIGRGRELRETGRLLDRAAGGAGGLLVFVGASGSGKTALAEAAAGEALRRGFRVLRGSPPAGQPGTPWSGRSCCATRAHRTSWRPGCSARKRGRWTWTARPGASRRRARG